MRTCRKCGKEFPFLVRVEGKIRNLSSRYFCLDCSPFGSHNTRDLTHPRTSKRKRPAPPTKCTKCGGVPPEVSFYPGSSTRYCKTCTNRLKLQRDVAFKMKAIEYKGGQCLRCGYTGHYAAFDFHHTRDKQMVWNMMRNVGWEKVKVELDKCELLCANCHRVLHAKPISTDNAPLA